MKKEENNTAFSREFNGETALNILRAFYLEARRELRRKALVKTAISEVGEAGYLHFEADGFNLELRFTEKGGEV